MFHDSGLRDADLAGVRGQIEGMQVAREDHVVGQPAQEHEDWGIGELPLQLEREREFVNVLRGADETRSLSDEDFAEVLEFTRAAFELALGFAERSAK